jgi:hypothetical protein
VRRRAHIAWRIAHHDPSYRSDAINGIGWLRHRCVLDSTANQCYTFGVFVGSTAHKPLFGTVRRRAHIAGHIAHHDPSYRSGAFSGIGWLGHRINRTCRWQGQPSNRCHAQMSLSSA